MFKPLAIYIGLRYTRSSNKSYFVSLISLTSMLGIGLGVMVLITVLSVMNGFDAEIHKRFFGMVPEITVTGPNDSIMQWENLQSKLEKFPGVNAAAPYAGGQGLLTYNGQVVPIILNGISLKYEPRVTHLNKKLLAGDFNNLSNFGILLGKTLAENLGVLVGDKVTIMIPEANSTPVGMVPRFKRFLIQGIFEAGTGFNFDTRLAFINLQDAQKLFQLQDKVSGIKLKIKDVYQAPEMTYKISHMLGENYRIGNWTDQSGAFFEALRMEKTMMFLILTLIIAVAAFNLISSLVMVVNDKQAEIAILRTIGATPKTILGIFIVQGMMVGIVGTIIGILGGLLLASHATEIVNWMQSMFHVQILPSSLYFGKDVPVLIVFKDLLNISVIALGLSFLATIYPAWHASKIRIAEALHHE